jgi:hypothetical protein
MYRRIYTAALTTFLFLSAQNALADVVDPSHLNRQFMFTNLDKFPDYTFYYLHVGFHYDRGYKANPPDTVLINNNERYFVSSRGDSRSPLFVKTKNGKFIVSDLKMGGAGYKSEGVEGITDVFTFENIVTTKNKKGIKRSAASIKKVKEITKFNDGTEKEKKDSLGIASFLGGDGYASGLTLASLTALLGMIFLFMLKKKRPNYIQLTS